MVTNINIYFNKFINYLKFLNSSNRLLRFARKDGTKTKKSQPYSRDLIILCNLILLHFFKNNNI